MQLIHSDAEPACDATISNAIDLLAARLIAMRPVVVMMVCETTRAGKSELHVLSVPDAVSVRAGIAEQLFEQLRGAKVLD